LYVDLYAICTHSISKKIQKNNDINIIIIRL